MGWDRKRRGAAGGYYYLSVRTPHGAKKVYYGRGAAGWEAAAEVAKRRQARRLVRAAIEAEREDTADADRLATELCIWADLLLTAWMTTTGHHYHRGSWRRKHG